MWRSSTDGGSVPIVNSTRFQFAFTLAPPFAVPKLNRLPKLFAAGPINPWEIPSTRTSTSVGETAGS